MKRGLLLLSPLLAGAAILAALWMLGRADGPGAATGRVARPVYAPEVGGSSRRVETGLPDSGESGVIALNHRIGLLRLLVTTGNRAAALDLIRQLKRGGLDALQALVAALRMETSPEMKQAIVEILDDILPGLFGEYPDGWYSNRHDVLAAIRDPANREMVEAFRALAVPALIDLVRNDGDTLTRRWAASALGQFGGVDALKALLEFSKAGGESGVTHWSLEALNQMWDPAGLPVIRGAMADPDLSPAVRAALARSLGTMGSDEAVDLLLSLGPGTLGPSYATTLAETGNPKALEELKRLASASPGAIDVATLLRFFPDDPFARDCVGRTLADPSLSLDRKLAVIGAGSMKWDEVGDWALAQLRAADPAARDGLLERMLRHAPGSAAWDRLLAEESDPTRRLMVLAHAGGPQTTEARDALRLTLERGSDEQRRRVLAMAWGDPEQWADAVASTAGGSAGQARLEAANFLSRAGRNDEAAALALDLVRGGDPSLRVAALDLLGRSAPERIAPLLGEVMSAARSENADLRAAALRGLGALGGDEGRTALRREMEVQPAQAVAQFGRAGFGVEEILGCVRDPRPEVRFAGIQALGSAKDAPAAERALWLMLEHEGDAGACHVMIQSLGGVGSRETVRRLEDWAASHPSMAGAVYGAKESIFLRLIRP